MPDSYSNNGKVKSADPWAWLKEEAVDIVKGAGNALMGTVDASKRVGRDILMDLREFGYGDNAKEIIRDYDADIINAAHKHSVDPNLIRAIIYEEQVHSLPFEDHYSKAKSFGLGQVTEGLHGYTEDQLRDRATNIDAVATHLASLKKQSGKSSVADLATLYNCGSCDTTNDYGRRVQGYYNKIFGQK